MAIYDNAPAWSQAGTFSGIGTSNPPTTAVAPASGPQGGTVNLTGTLTSNGAPLAAGGSVTLAPPNGSTASAFTYTKTNFAWGGPRLARPRSPPYPHPPKPAYPRNRANTIT